VSQQVALTNLDDGMILFYSNAKVTSPAVKQALTDVIGRKREIERLAQERGRREQEIQAVTQEQERIRQNMAQLDRASDLYTRYVTKFAEQEDRVETLRKEIAALQDQEQQARRGLDEMLVKLEIE
jgi:septal ring factor EnvC (AmiA/AmiB activator)